MIQLRSKIAEMETKRVEDNQTLMDVIKELQKQAKEQSETLKPQELKMRALSEIVKKPLNHEKNENLEE